MISYGRLFFVVVNWCNDELHRTGLANNQEKKGKLTA